MINILLKGLCTHLPHSSVLKVKVTRGVVKGGLWKCKSEWLYWLKWIPFSCH